MPDNILNHSTAAERSAWGKRAAERTAARHVDVDVDAITFGVEIECYVPMSFATRHNLQRGGYHAGAPMRASDGWPTFRGQTWNCQGDGSLQGTPFGYVPVEIVSPVLHGKEGLASVVAMAEMLTAGNAKADKHCGLHVHVGMPSILGERRTDHDLVRSWVARLVSLVSKHEMALIGLGGVSTRLNNHYCQTIKDNWKGFRVWSNEAALARRARADGRYRVLNLQHLFDNKQTVEFRVFAGTVNPRKIFGYVVTALGLAERAADKPRAVAFTAENYTLDQVRALDFEALVGELGKDLRGYGWPTGAEQLIAADTVRDTQLWNARKMHRDLNA